MKSLLARLACLGWLCFSLSVQAEPVDVAAARSVKVTPVIEWCATAPSVTLGEVLAGACTLKRAAPGDLPRGLDGHSFWLRFTLANSEHKAIDRWLVVGNPRLEQVSLFLPDASLGWRRVDSGINVPFARREHILRAYGAFPLTLQRESEQTMWLRVASRGAIDLSVTAWVPSEYHKISDFTELNVMLALGGLLIAAVYAFLVFIVTREKMYLSFGMAMLGEILIESFRSGLLQHYWWPLDWPMYMELSAVGVLMAMFGYFGSLHGFLPGIRSHRRTYRALAGFVAITGVGLCWAIGLDFLAATRIWTLTMNLAIACSLVLLWLEWRSGKRMAGIMLVVFVCLAILEVLRLGMSHGLLPYFWGEAIAGPWALVLTTPLILISIFQTSRDLRDQLIQSRSENAARIEFLAQMSHELRTPLNTILGNAQLLARPDGNRLAPDGLATIQHSGKHLLGMIDEILDHARGLAGKLVMHPETVDWTSFMNSIAQNARLLAAANGNEFILQGEASPVQAVVVDEGRLRQILDNLLSNAARHTHDGKIMLHWTMQRQQGDTLRIEFSVTDTGEGIPPADQERIFLPFERGSRSARQGGKGMGMGLTIARQLVEAMGGALSLESWPGEGTCFSFSILAREGSVAAVVVPADNDWILGARHDGPLRHILLVDDETDNLHILVKLLENSGFCVHQAPSGKAAIALVQSGIPLDLVLTDQFMADGDGWDVLEALDTLRPGTPVVLMSAALARRPESFPADLHFAAYWLKPKDHREILHSIGELLKLDWLRESPGFEEEEGPDAVQFPGSEAERQTLCELIESGRVTDIMEWAKTQKAREPGHAPFAERILHAARQLDFPALYSLAGMTREESGGIANLH